MQSYLQAVARPCGIPTPSADADCPVQLLLAAHRRLSPFATIAVAALLAACESSGPRTGFVKITIQGLPEGTAAQVTLRGPDNFSRVLSRSDVVASLKPGTYVIAGESVLSGSARFSPSPDTQSVTIGKSSTPVEVTVTYQPATGSLELIVAGAPAGSTPIIRVTGPRGFDRTVISEANKDQFLVDVRRMLPVLDIDTEIHAPYTTLDSVQLRSTDQWTRVLSEVDAIRVVESSQHPSARNYYGVVKVDYDAGFSGYALIAGHAAVGWDRLPSGITTAAHELAHNFGRRHAPCGGAAAPDPSYPYPDGTIGVYGFDLLNNELKPPSSFDLMSYCGSRWISDYTYVGAMTWRENNSSQTAAAAALGVDQDATPRPALLVWGRVERGKLVLEPAFSIVARPAIPQGGGPNRLEGVARNGRTLFSYDFAGEEPADAEDPTARLFAFAIPLDESTQAVLATIRVSGGGSEPAVMHASLAPGGISASVSALTTTTRGNGMVNVHWGGQGARMAMVRDRATGQVLSFARGSGVDVQPRSSDLEVTFSDGVRSVMRQVKVGPE